MSRQRVVAALSVCALVLMLAISAMPQRSAPTAQTDDQTPGIPKFYAESRQILVEADVWGKTREKGEHPWIGGENLRSRLERQIIEQLVPVSRALEKEDFHIFDNGIEQKINYFKESDFPAFDNTNHWYMVPSIEGTWGIYDDGPHYGPPEASYMIGYVPPPSAPGKCRTLKVVVEGHDVEVNRDSYCVQGSGSGNIEALAGEKIGNRMREVAQSSKPMRDVAPPSKQGSSDITLHASTLWSSGVLTVARESLPSVDPPVVGTDFTYVVEVHDSKAPATVQITAGFDFYSWRNWDYPCKKNPALYILGIAYKANGDVAGQFADTYSCLGAIRLSEHYRDPQGLGGVYIPLRFDTQLALRPGDYDLVVVAGDGDYFHRAKMPLHVETLDPQRLMVSDLVVAGIVRYAGWVFREAAAVNPAPVVPSPLVSKDSQYFPDSDQTTHLGKHTPLYVYFEIYEPQIESPGIKVYYQWRITDQKTGSVVISTEQVSAADWMIPGNVVIPVGLTLYTERLKKSFYKLELLAADSGGRESGWRAVDFNVK